jgi:hypothetical protein
LFGALTGLAIVIVSVASVLLFGFVQGRAVAREFPNAIVLRTGRTADIREAMSRFHALFQFDAATTSIPLYFSLVADKEGIAFLSNATTVFARLAWSAVDNVQTTAVIERARVSNGIEIDTNSPEGSFRFSLVIVGRGLFGAFPKQVRELDSASEGLEALRRTARDLDNTR